MPVSGVHVHDQDPSQGLGRVSPAFGQPIWHDVGRCRPLRRSSLGWQHRRSAGGGYHRFVARGGVPSDPLARRASVLLAHGAGRPGSGHVLPMVALFRLTRVHRRSICSGRPITIRPQKNSRQCLLTPLLPIPLERSCSRLLHGIGDNEFLTVHRLRVGKNRASQAQAATVTSANSRKPFKWNARVG